MAPYIEQHKDILRRRNLGKSELWISRQHQLSFAAWLQQHLIADEGIDNQLAWLARGPSSSISTFQGYEINGYIFYTRAQDKKSTNQNSGVRIDAMDNDGNKTHTIVT